MTDMDASDQSEFWKEFRGQTFQDDTLVIDYHRYVDCTIEDCVLIYGGGPFHMSGCRISGCQLRYTGAAANTLKLWDIFNRSEPGVDEAGNITLG